MAVLEANLLIATKGAAGAGDAFSILDLAATRYPLDVEVQRARIALVSAYGKWQAADRSIDGFKLALYRATGGAYEANVAAVARPWSQAPPVERLLLGVRLVPIPGVVTNKSLSLDSPAQKPRRPTGHHRP